MKKTTAKEVNMVSLLHKSKKLIEGFTHIIGPDNSEHKLLSLGRLYFSESNHPYSAQTKNKEVVLDILRGTCDVRIQSSISNEIKYEKLGERLTPFTGRPTMVYLPKEVNYTIIPRSYPLDILVCTAPSTRDSDPTVVKPKDVVVTSTGKANWRRDVQLAVGANVPAQRLIVGETLNPPGNWSGSPPHRHDTYNPPFQVPLEEIYLFLVEPSQGFGLGRVYTAEDDPDPINEVYVIENNDVLSIPKGYHCIVAGPGYGLCYFFVLAGEKRQYGLFSDDPKHSWLRNCESILEEEEKHL